jgi:hypothetical protein
MLQFALALIVGLVCCTNVLADPFVEVLTSAEKNQWTDQWEGTSKEITPQCPTEWSVKKYSLHGGKQEGVDVILIDNGMTQIAICPTRGMGILWAKRQDVRLGWNSPVKEIVNPKWINLSSRGGLGWLEGFNEFVCRCGMEWAGHPGTDKFINNVGEEATMELTLHGRVENLPASEVEVVVEREAPYRIKVRGRVDERMFYGPKLELWTELSTEPGTPMFRIHDTLTNRGAAEQEFQVIYHSNFGAPLLEKGSRFIGTVGHVTPFNAHAAEGIASYTEYSGPTLGFVEQVYKIRPQTISGQAMGMLVNAGGDKAASIAFSVDQLPYLTLWKNTNAEAEGYVTGIEPGTGFPHNRRIERSKGRVPKLAAGASRSFDVDYAIYLGSGEVTGALAKVAALQGPTKPIIDSEPEKID